VRTCHISQISVSPERIRKHIDPGALQELAESIQANGLYHALVLQPAPNGEWTLIAGERRLRALQQLISAGEQVRYDAQTLPPGHVPFATLADLDPITALTVELEENVIRRDISWQERVAAEKRLHELRCQLNPQHTFADTARIIHGDAATPQDTFNTKLNVTLAAHLDDPEIANAKTEREAVAIARRKLERLFVSELAARLPDTSASHALHLADATDFLANAPAASVDVILTDPPYGIGMHECRPQSTQQDRTLTHAYADDFETAQRINLAIAKAACLKPDAHIFLFCDVRLFATWHKLFSDHGWYVWPQPMIWYKGGTGSLLGHANGPRHCYEAILFAQRGFKRFKESVPDVLEIRPDVSKQHAAQKPVELYTRLLKLSADPGDTVLDPCCGSGTIFPAATALKLKAIGVENDESSYNLAKTRLAHGAA